MFCFTFLPLLNSGQREREYDFKLWLILLFSKWMKHELNRVALGGVSGVASFITTDEQLQ